MRLKYCPNCSKRMATDSIDKKKVYKLWRCECGVVIPRWNRQLQEEATSKAKDRKAHREGLKPQQNREEGYTWSITKKLKKLRKTRGEEACKKCARKVMRKNDRYCYACQFFYAKPFTKYLEYGGSKKRPKNWSMKPYRYLPEKSNDSEIQEWISWLNMLEG